MKHVSTSRQLLFTGALVKFAATFLLLAAVRTVALGSADELLDQLHPERLTDWHLLAAPTDSRLETVDPYTGAEPLVALACRPYVNVSLNEQGFAIITPAMLLLDPTYDPYHDYSVDIMGPLTNTVYCAQVGQELMVIVKELPTGNTCMSTIKVEDKLKPTFLCTPDVVSCTVDISELNFEDYLDGVFDNCDNDLDLWYSYTIQNLPCNANNYTQQINVTWTATDDSGNSATCTDILYLVRPSLGQVQFPPNTIVSCTDPNIDPSVTGEPTVNGEPITHTCQIVVGYTDNMVPMCNGAYKVLRLWRVMDWCTGQQVTKVQEILVVDDTPPVLNCPPNVTLGTDPGVCTRKYTLPAPASVSDACAPTNQIAIKIKLNTVPGYFVPGQMVTLGLGVSTITMTATDPCGNSSTCIYLVTIRDNTPPVIFCPPDVTIQCSGNTLPVATGSATATDFCTPQPVITYTDATMSNPGCAVGYKITRTWVATDNAGNSAMCMQMISLTDTQPPAITCPANTTVQCGTSTLPAATGTATATDSCDPSPSVNFSDATVAGACPQEYTINRTWVASDDCNNTSTCLQVIQVVDDLAPEITCPPDITIMCDDPSDPSETGTATATDNCDPAPSITYNDVTMASGGPQSYLIIRTWTAEDHCGNSNNCTQEILVVDMTIPVFTFCPPNITIECTEEPVPAVTGQPTASDNCDPMVDITFEDESVPGSCPQESTITRTWTATDDCGNSTVCIQVITIDDSVPPAITCPLNVTIECTESTAPGNTGMATAVDNCDPSVIPTFNDVTAAGACAQEYTITRTWTAVDDCGNQSTCQQIIVIQDTQVPSISCPVDITIACSASTDPAVNMALGTATATDNCDPSVVPTYTDEVAGGACPQESVITRTWIAMDDCGNSAMCVQSITVQDNLPPAITCPANVTIECTASTLPANTGSATAVDDCDPSVTPTFEDITTGGGCPQEYTITRTWTAVDDCGNGTNCIQVISVMDNTAPVITCPPNVTIACTASTLPANTGSATASDACDPSVVPTYSDVTTGGGCPQEYIITRTWIAGDDCGNTSTCVQTITIDDNIAPAIACPSNITISCGANTEPANTGMATATDNCDISVIPTYSDVTAGGTCPQEFTITRTWVATDDCGNSSSCVQTITIDDNIPPTIECPDNVTILCTASTDPANTGSATAIDVCDATPTITFLDNIIAGDCEQEYTINRQWTATDDCGNASTCTQVIQVVDLTPPVITCPANVTIQCTDSTDPEVNPVLGFATATDNCAAEPIIAYSDVSNFGQCPFLITITRTWTASDGCGNIATCVQTIVLTDSEGPVITCPADVTIDCTASTDPANTGNPVVTDDCDTEPVVGYSDVTSGTGCPEGFSIVRTWTATDACGNSATCVQNILVDDNTAPNIICPADVTLDCNEDTSPENTGGAVASDNCAPTPSITFSDVTTGTGCPIGYLITRTWVAEDDCGNTASCVQLITVDDNAAPLITCPVDMTIECSESTSPDNTGLATATDGCDPEPEVTFADATVAGACPETYTINRTWTATDACGNSTQCMQTIVLEDTTSPTCVTQDITVTLDGAGMATITPAQVDNGSADACGPVTLAVSPNMFDCEDIGNNVVTLTVTDCTGNSSSCTANVFIEEGAGLQASCQNVTIFLDANGNASVDPTEVNNGSGGGCNPGMLEFDLSQTDFTCANLGPNVVVLTVTDEQGNTATCTAIITVIDNMPPTITCPADVTVDCHTVTDPENTGQFGNATASDNCPPAIITETHVINLSNCNEGTIVRTFVATDGSGNTASCTQTVTVTNPNPFDEGDITWPASPVNVNICNSTLPQNIPNGQPTFDPTALLCADISVSYTDDVQVIVDNDPNTPCQIITRTWTVTNNCTPVTTFMFVQTINVVDNMAPVFTNINDMTKTASPATCTASFTLIANATDCAGVSITNNSPYGVNTGANASGNYPIGVTVVIFTATDGCGNTSTMDVVITVLDPDPTVFECEKTIVFLPPETEIALPADTFVTFFEGACTTAEDFLVSYSGTNPYDTVEIFDCGDVGVTTFPLYFWMNGMPPVLIDTCPFADLDLRDPNDFCMDGLVVSGNIGNENGLPLEGVEVTVANAPMSPDMTDGSGGYWIDGFVEGGNYDIRPVRDINHKEGVSTLDLVMIQKHLLGKARLNSPYKLIAADANHSGHITALDLIEIRKLILGIYERFPNNTSWRFVDKDFAFPDPYDPFATIFPESIWLDHVMEMQGDVDFVAIKVGDVNGSFFTKALDGQLEGRSIREYGMSIREIPEMQSATRIFELRVDEGQPAIEGLQMSLDLGRLSVDQVNSLTSDVLSADQYHYDAASGLVRISFTPQSAVVPEGKALLRWTDETTGEPTYSLHIGDLAPEAYIADGERPEVWRLTMSAAEYLPEMTTDGYELFQNVPNPFDESTAIRFQLPGDELVRVSVFDQAGRQLHTIQHAGKAGMNEVKLSAGILGTPGIYYYTLYTGQASFTRKMSYTPR